MPSHFMFFFYIEKIGGHLILAVDRELGDCLILNVSGVLVKYGVGNDCQAALMYA